MRDPSTIIYRLSCRDLLTQEELLRYSTTPFEGFIESHGNTRTEHAPMDVMLYIQGNKLKDRKSQHRSTFGTNRDPDPEPFVVGEDFFARVIEPTYIRILSPHIQNVLRKLVLYYPGHDLQGRELLFKEPYRVLVHYHDDLQRVAEAYNNEDKTAVLGDEADESLTTVTCDETTHNHLNILLNSPTYKDHYEGVIEPELQNYENGYASYDMLWLLFKPGDTVFARVRKDLAGFVVLAADHTPDPFGVSPLDKWTIQVWNLAYTGQRLTRQAHEFTIDRYNGLCKIDELNIFPKQFLKDDGRVEEELIARGAEYFKIVCGLPAHRRYSGSVIANHLVQYNGEIMVDPSGYLTYAPKRGSKADFYTHFAKPLDLDGGPRWSKFNDMVCNERNMPTPDQLLLFSSHVLGFALQRKEWMIFEMKYVYPVDEDKQAMKRVVLEPSEREMLMGMIGDDSIDSWNAEFIEGKGRGQVILLYGHPGTGKTFTVECVAKHTNRPLLSLTVADLGTEETTMEAKLAKWLDRATSWNGIVLIDEADIYLERREKEDLSRNSLVTAFLRTMEYYSGTMFLTTNRPGAIDPAFTSRIHLFLGYKTLTPSSRPQVWDGFFNKLEREQRKLRPGVRRLNIPSSTQNFAKNDPMMLGLNLNGREIRNILQSAINLARYHARGEEDEEIDITADLLRKVVENRTQYKNAIKAIDGLSESARAHDSGWIAE
ncbi:P-loop containing nucleoside triphosphate hydrolase protein [Leptodontidium sp. MPI-SDFR-AT-0119]|nr:P-loop containing nucleoside triphosphate hydrolase protein [Leptodontidium sp. MPI-SDFR-AT-0119]